MSAAVIARQFRTPLPRMMVPKYAEHGNIESCPMAYESERVCRLFRHGIWSLASNRNALRTRAATLWDMPKVVDER
jgi:hypothetical protein